MVAAAGAGGSGRAAPLRTSARVTTPPPEDVAQAALVQADGKIVAAGRSMLGFAVARYRDNGKLDRGFGALGRVVTRPFAVDYQGLNAAAAQRDGKLVAAGWTFNRHDGSFVLARYTPGGRLDKSFGRNGSVATTFGGTFEEATAIAVQGDGKIVATGDSTVTSLDESTISRSLVVARYLPGGKLDPSFGNAGKASTRFSSDTTDLARAVAIQADGALVIAGSSTDPTGRDADFALARYLADGRLDPTFGSGGKVTTGFGPTAFDEAYAVAVQSDGKLVVAGRSKASAKAPFDFALARYLPDGSLDPSFGHGGEILTGVRAATFDEAHAVVVQGDGKIVAAGSSGPAARGPFDFALARYLPDGALDPSFGKGGLILTGFGAAKSDIASALAQQPDGDLVAAGVTGPRSEFVLGDFALARYGPNGRLDPNFGSGGKARTDFARAYTRLGSISARRRGSDVLVRWRTLWEVSNRSFTLFRTRRTGSATA